MGMGTGTMYVKLMAEAEADIWTLAAERLRVSKPSCRIVRSFNYVFVFLFLFIFG